VGDLPRSLEIFLIHLPQGAAEEMYPVNQELTEARWRKSSFSGDDGSNCVEIAVLPGGRRVVRDTKNSGGPVVGFTCDEWTAFLDHLKIGY
jgi:hypothetical protein